ncbi:MAG: hypothetical protein ABIY52_01370 [Gemmatimonadaceae bacterium]
MRSRGNTEEDYLLRVIKQAADAIRLLRHRLMGTTSSIDGVRAGAATAIGALLGPRASLIDKLDASSAAQLVGHPDTVDLWADLLEVDAEAAERDGDVSGAALERQRVRELRAAVIAIWGPRQDP